MLPELQLFAEKNANVRETFTRPLLSPLHFELPSTPELRKAVARATATHDRLRLVRTAKRALSERRRLAAGLTAIVESPPQLVRRPQQAEL
jgi:hypothetical protein